jgi:pSer/pThr/pTyr-binding forkhead associated (FHA) protein
MITVGRARNNDIVVPDALVSKLHAFFRCHDGQWSLEDAGSVNGTRVGAATIAYKGPAGALRSGDHVTFGEQSFRFVDAPTLWIALR